MSTMARTVTMKSPVTIASGTTVHRISSFRDPKICLGSAVARPRDRYRTTL